MNSDPSMSRRLSSLEFDRQIRQLDIDGKILRGIENTEAPLMTASRAKSLSDALNMNTSHFPRPSTSLTGITDLSTEQRTITELRSELDVQKKEIEQFQMKMLQGSSAMTTPMTSAMTTPLTTASSSYISSRLPTSPIKHTLTYTQSQLDRRLQDYQDQINEMKNRTKEKDEIHEQQKKHFRENIEDLKRKLQGTMQERDSLVDLRQRETQGQEALINKLQSTLDQLNETNHHQERSLLETNSKIGQMQQNYHLLESTFGQVRNILTDVERKRGRPYYDGEPILNQSVSMVVHTLERCVQEFDSDLTEQTRKVKQLQGDLEETKSTSNDLQERVLREHHDKLTHLSQSYEQQIETSNERASNSRKQTESLQSQLTLLEEQSRKQSKLKDEIIKDLETKMSKIKQDQTEDASTWHEKKRNLELAMDDMQKELSSMRSEKDSAIRNMAAFESRIQDYETTVAKLQHEADGDKEQMKKLWEREDNSSRKNITLESQLLERENDVERLEAMLETIRSEAQTTIQTKISVIERNERQKAADHLNMLTEKLNSITEKYNKTCLELEYSNKDVHTHKERHSELLEKLESVKIQLETTSAEKNNLTGLLEDRTGDLQRISQERDYYFQILEDRNAELASLKGHTDKLSVQLEERERNFVTLHEQHSNISHLVEVNSQTSSSMKEERDKLMNLINEKTVEIQELKHARDSTARKLKIREKKLRDYESEKNKLSGDLEGKAKEVDVLLKEKEELYIELKESRYEVASLTEEKDNMMKSLQDKTESYNTNITKMSSKLKSAEQELKISKKTLKTKETIDDKAYKVAGKMQKEVTEKRSVIDDLKSKLHWFEECLDVSIKEKKSLLEERQKLLASIDKQTSTKQKIKDQLNSYTSKNKELTDMCSRLEAALEKAAQKYSHAHSKIEKLEQESAKLKLHHQLELKEASQRSITTISGSRESPFTTTHAAKDVNTSCIATQTTSPITVSENKEKSEDNLTVTDLKSLLSEMKQLIFDRQHPSPQSISQVETVSRLEDQSAIDGTMNTRHLGSRYHGSTRESPMTSSPFPRESLPYRSQSSDSISSLTSYESKRNRPSTKRLRDYIASKDSSTGFRGAPDRVTNDAHELCKRLEEKLQNLTKMGGNLELENKEMAALISDQGKKLKKVRDSSKKTVKQVYRK